MAPSTCEALVIRQKGSSKPELVRESIEVPKPADNQLLVKITYAAQNPTDSTHLPPKQHNPIPVC